MPQDAQDSILSPLGADEPASQAGTGARTARTGMDVVILNGRQSGVRTRLREGRYLIGNREDECDLVVDLGVSTRTICLLRCEPARMEIMLLEGDAWLGPAYVVARETLELAPLRVLTLGRVSLVVCPSEQEDLSGISVPTTLLRPGEAPDTVVPLLRREPERMRRLKQLRWVTLGALSIVLSITVYTASLTWMVDPPDVVTQLDAERRAVAQLVFELGLDELSTDFDATQGQVIISGYVNSHEDLRELEVALDGARRSPFLRVEVVEPIQQALEGGLRGVPLMRPVRYQREGRFEFGIASNQLSDTVTAVRAVFRAQPGLKSIDLRLHDVVSAATGQAVSYQLTRSRGRAGEVDVVGDPLPASASITTRPLFMDVRHGRIPSVVTRDGVRLFEGAYLPDGSVIRRIAKDHVVVARGDVERTEALGSRVEAAGDEHGDIVLDTPTQADAQPPVVVPAGPGSGLSSMRTSLALQQPVQGRQKP